MSLIQFCNKAVNPVREDEFFSTFFPSVALARGSAQWFPALDVIEGKENYSIKIDLPGLKREDVHVSFDSGILTIEGERVQENEQKDKEYHRIERSYGRFVRSLNLGSDVDAEKIQATYKEGVLEITVAKIQRAQSKAIDIKVG